MDLMNLELLWNGAGSSVYGRENLLFMTGESVRVSVLSLSESFQREGMYCFAPSGLEDRAGFAKLLAEEYPLDRRENLCFLWIAIQSGMWAACKMYGRKTGNALILERYFQSGRERYRLTLDKGTLITCDGSRFLLEAGETGAEILSCILGDAVAERRPSQVSIDCRGSICFAAEVQTSGDVFKDLDVGIRYYSAVASEVGAPAKEAVNLYQSNVFSSCGELKLSGRWNPGNLYEQDATCFYIEAGTRMGSSMCDWVGNTFTVTAVPDSALVLEQKPVFLYQEDGAVRAVLKDCMGPAGAYQVHSDSDGAGKERMLCGLGGTEFVVLENGRGVLSFLPGQRGFLWKGQRMNLGTTAYVTMPLGSSFVRQPKTAPLFGVVEKSYLDFLSVPLLQVTERTASLPMMFYGDFQVTGETGMTGGELEDLLCAFRMEDLGVTKSSRTLAAERIRGVTPQGLLVEICERAENPGAWSMIGLANTEEGASELPRIRFMDIADRMRGAFQQVQMQLLYEDAKELMELCQTPDEFEFATEGWSFLLKPERWLDGKNGGAKTIMILKYQTTSSIREWLGTHPVMSASIRRAYDGEQKPREEYAEFLEVVDNREFQGILFLNCPVKADCKAPGFLKEFTLILDSIDQTQLCAHHLILHHSRIVMENGVLCMEHGDVSALVDYVQEGRIAYQPEALKVTYDFSTREFSLSVRGGNISRASSISELLVNDFFASPGKKTKGTAGNSLAIAGRLQESDGLREFLYSLREPGEYELLGSGLTHIRIEEVTMNMNMTNSCFHLGGRLFFQYQEQSDLFSYGYKRAQKANIESDTDEEAEEEGGLKFTELLLLRDHGGKMDMEYRQILLRPGDSMKRADGLASRFPAFAGKLLHRATEMPEDLGYHSITAPVSQSRLTQPWFGIVYRIPIGGLGGLSSEGILGIELLAAWCFGEVQPGYYIGIKLPGEGGLKLQGIFQMGFSSIVLQNTKKDGVSSYALILNQLAVKILGLTFPKGENRMTLFAGPDGKQLGWFAVYKEED